MTPTRYPITITLETPAAFSDAPAMGNETGTLEYIPGSALRGMLANLYLAGKKEDAAFRRLFVEGGIQFGNLHPEPGRRLPLSAYSCKQHAGFTGDKLPSFMAPPHRVVDRLWEDFLPEPPQRCADCQQPLTQLERTFYTGHNAFESVSPTLTSRMSTAVVGNSGSARQGSLHSQQELAAQQTFNGYLVCSQADLATLQDGLGGQEIQGYLGRKRSGLVKVSLEQKEKNWDEPLVVSSPKYPGKAFAALTCTSDLILVDELLRPVTSLTTENLAVLSSPPARVEIVKAFAASRTVAGWLGIGKIFKENDLAITAGSTFLLQFRENDQQVVQEWMQRLAVQGLGLRRSEGFGQVTFSEPLHDLSWKKLQSHLKNKMEDFRL